MFAIAVSAFVSSMIAAAVIVVMARTFAEHGPSALRALTGEPPSARPCPPAAVREWRSRPARTMPPQRPLRAAA